LGFGALAWFCLRTFSKPSRITYPCQQAVAPVAAGFLLWVGGLYASSRLFRASTSLWREHKFASLVMLLGAIGIWVAIGPTLIQAPLAQNGVSTGIFVAKDSPNSPIGIARGIKPGRVSWVRDQSAVLYSGQGSYAEDAGFNQGLLDNMLSRVVTSVPAGTSLRTAWDSLFTSNNRARGRTARGYTAGEKIAIKVNLNSDGSTTIVDQTPQLVKSLLRQLVDTLGVAQANILVYDVIRTNGTGTIKRICEGEFPNVRYNNFTHPAGDWVDTLKYSNAGIPASSRQTSRWVAQAEYLINFAILKRHTLPNTAWSDWVGQAAITVTGKNHCGTTRDCASLHPYFRDYYTGDKSYNAVVDFMSGPVLHDKTVLFLVDGLFTANHHAAGPLKWNMTPFNGNYPASVFASQDQVAIESVSLDFLNTEMSLPKNADNFLHEAALIGNPPSGVNYVNRGTYTSMGAHEHWNNPIDKKYSRNLGNGQGIELFTVPLTGTPTTVSKAPQAKNGLELASQVGGGIMIRSTSPLRSAEIFDARGITLAKFALAGTQANINPSRQAGAAYLRVRTQNEVATRALSH
jgi:hypothetical protein